MSYHTETQSFGAERPDFSFLPGLVKKGFGIIMDIYRQDFKVEFKGEKDPLTLADKLVDELYIREIRSLFPNSFILTEESYEKGMDIPPSFWCIDPLDGTKDFILKNGEFCTMIAYIMDNEPMAGIIGIPVKEQIIFAENKKGAFLMQKGKSERESIKLIPKDIDTAIYSGRLTAVHSRNHQNNLLFNILDRLGIRSRLVRGSVGYKVATILSGEADLYIHPSKHTKWWDTAAGEVILQEAGGCFTDLYNNKLVYFGNNVLNINGITASRFTGHSFLESIADILDEF